MSRWVSFALCVETLHLQVKNALGMSQQEPDKGSNQAGTDVYFPADPSTTPRICSFLAYARLLTGSCRPFRAGFASDPVLAIFEPRMRMLGLCGARRLYASAMRVSGS